jgi:serine/threonine protein kinase
LVRPFAGVSQEDVDNEVRAIKKLCQHQHPNIVQVFKYGRLKTDGAFYFIDMELCENSLEKYIYGQLQDDADALQSAYSILQQILNGLIYIHCLKEVHRDLSPHNGTYTLSLSL